MTLRIGNAPCSWGVEFAGDPRNPPWRRVLAECAGAGYDGIELGPIGFMPEDPAELGDALAHEGLALIGGVVFRPFHDPAAWPEVEDAARRTARSLAAHGARHMVLIDSISPRRAATAGRADEAERMAPDEWEGLVGRLRDAARIGAEEFGLRVSLHPHAGGFVDFLPEVERLLAAVDPALLGLCLDTGHSTYAGFDPLPVIERHADRLAYLHLKSTSRAVRERAVAERTGFYEACAQGIFCNLDEGEVDFPALRDLLARIGYEGWATVEQDCDPAGTTVPRDDAARNRAYLRATGY